MTNLLPIVVDGVEYILAQVDESKIALINVRYGIRWCDSVTVNDVKNITSEEFYAVTGTEPYNFTKIE